MSPLHSGWLTTEVAALAGILDGHGLDARVTVYETGTTGLASSEAYYPGLSKGVGSPTDAQVLVYQASEVWRRLLAAKAGGAEQVGWHAWMSSGTGTYDGFGLRVVSERAADPASKATARPSWFAFQRLATLLQDAGEVRLVRPGAALLPTRAELTLRAVAGSVAGAGVFPDVLVYEIAGLSVDALGGTVLTTYSYAYVALVDPTAPGAAPLSVLATAPVGPDPSVLRLEPFTTDPAAWSIAPDLASIPSEYEEVWLPTYAWWDSIPPPSAVALPPGGKAVFEVQRGGAPLVLLSKVRLSWPE